MQLAVITDEISQDFEHALDVMGEYGAAGAELRGLWGINIADLTDEQVARAKAAMEARNIRPICLATPFFKCDLSPETENAGEAAGRMHLAKPRGLEQQMEMLRRCIAIAHTLDVTFLRVFSFWKKDLFTPEIEARIVAAFADPVALAAEEDMILLLENEHACYIGTGEEAARVAAAVDSPHFKLVWDPGNAFSAGEVPYPDGYEAVRPYMAHVHIKDARMVETPSGAQPKWCVVGEGDIDYTGQFAAWKRDGYTGYISLETHYIPETGSGEERRGTPEDGSRPCLAALNTFLA